MREKGTGFMQGFFVNMIGWWDDEVTDIRNGGLGSTTCCSGIEVL